MPIYEYACDGCGGRFETLAHSPAAPIPACPECGAQPRRLPPTRVALGRRAQPPPGPQRAPRSWEETRGGDRETILHWQRTLERRRKIEEKYPELAEDSPDRARPVLAHEGPYAARPLRAGDHGHPDPQTPQAPAPGA